MIQVTDLTKRYGQTEAIRGLSFTVEKGQVVGLLGPNGAGKTTTMRILTTFFPPTSGSASVAGFDVCEKPFEVRKRIGYLPETPPLYPEFRVRDYLCFVANLKGVEKNKISSSVDEVIERCGLTEMSSRVCSQLSKGYRQRVGLAQALVHKPEVVVLDEPTSGLDPAQIIEVRELIRRLGGEQTVLLSTHILPEVTATCSKVVIIAQGEVVVEGALEELTQEQTLEQRFLAAVAEERV